MVQDKNSLACLSQGGCYPDDREDGAHCLLLSRLILAVKHNQEETHNTDTEQSAHTLSSVSQILRQMGGETLRHSLISTNLEMEEKIRGNMTACLDSANY